MDIRDYSKSELELVIDDWIIHDIYCDRNRQIIKDRLFLGCTYDDLSNKYYLSEDQIKKIISKCRKIIMQHLPKSI